MKIRLQNKIAESALTLPITCVATALLWWLPQGGYSLEYLLGMLTCAVTTCLVIKTASDNALLRVRSQMIGALFLWFLAACGFLHPLQSGTVILCLFSISFFYLLRTYDKDDPEVDTFHAYLFISLASLVWPPLLWLSIVLLWCQLVYMRSLSWRCFGAVLCGVLLPYAFWAAGAFFLNDVTPLSEHITSIIYPFRERFYWQWVIDDALQYEWSSFWSLFLSKFHELFLHHLPEGVALIVVFLFGLTGMVHYSRKNFDDKIRVRMCHYCYMVFQIVLFLWILLKPQYFMYLFPLLLLSAAPTAAHFITLTHTWITNVWSIILGLGLAATSIITLFNNLL